MSNEKTPAVSVVMSVYNGGKFLRPNGIGSILNQTFQDFEFIIVDDGSTDGSTEVIKQAAQEDARIRAVFLNQNAGIARARNAGLSIARGKYMMVQDAEDISYPNRMQQQFDFMEANPSFTMVGAAMKVVNLMVPENATMARQAASDYLSGARETTLHYPNAPERIKEIVMRGSMPSTHLVFFVRMAALRKIGGYHPALPVAEDMDLFFRLYALGDGIGGGMTHLPDVLVDHIVHGDNSANRVPLWKATCAIAASKSHLARIAGQPDFLAGRETPPGLDILDIAQNPNERLTFARYIIGSLLWGIERAENHKLFWQLLQDEVLTKEMPLQIKTEIVSGLLNDILNYSRQYYPAHFTLLQELLRAIIQLVGKVENLDDIKNTIQQFLASKQQDATWLENLV
ncbi:MAG: glycosyltransferase family A protein [Hydrotalea sp.]|nr:glycosyltransferase family A protein [Hydrotalea sp.]